LRSEILSQEKNITKIKVEVQVDTFRQKIDEAVEVLRSKANIKGFRKGHVPRKVLEMHIGPDAIRAEAIENLVPEMIDKVVSEYELDLISEPKVEIDSLEPEKPVEMTFIFETRPEVELPDLETIRISMKSVNVTEKMLDEAIMTLRENSSDNLPIEDRDSRSGDLLEIEYSVEIPEEGDKPLDTSPEKQKGKLELGSSSLRAELSSALEGRRAGDHVEVDVNVESEGGSEGRIVHYNIDIISVSEKILPEMDASFFQKVTEEPDLTEAQFREKVMERLQDNFRQESKDDAENRALAQLIEKSVVEVPENLVEKQKQAIISEMAGRVKKQTGKTLDEFFAEKNMEREPFEARSAAEAMAMVKRSLVLESVAARELIQVENSDIDQEMRDMSRSFGVPETQMQQFFLKNKSGIADLVHRIRMRKTVERIMEKIVIDQGAEEYNETLNADDISGKEGS